MKGLILKDIYNVRFQIIGGILIILSPNILMWFSVNSESASGLFGALIYGMINYLMIATCSSFMLNTISDDYRTGWAKMQRTMPLSANRIVGAKMLAVALIVGFLTMISLIFNIAGAIVYNMELEPMITMPFVAAFLQMITLSVPVVLGYKSKAQLITPVYILMVLVISAAIIALLFGVVNSVVSVELLRVIGYAVIPVIASATVVICCKNGRKAVECDI